MEAMGFQRGLNHLLDLGLDIGVMVTDRSPSIRKLMRESYGNIRHEYDPWHVNKSMHHIYKISTYSHVCDWLLLVKWNLILFLDSP